MAILVYGRLAHGACYMHVFPECLTYVFPGILTERGSHVKASLSTPTIEGYTVHADTLAIGCKIVLLASYMAAVDDFVPKETHFQFTQGGTLEKTGTIIAYPYGRIAIASQTLPGDLVVMVNEATGSHFTLDKVMDFFAECEKELEKVLEVPFPYNKEEEGK